MKKLQTIFRMLGVFLALSLVCSFAIAAELELEITDFTVAVKEERKGYLIDGNLSSFWVNDGVIGNAWFKVHEVELWGSKPYSSMTPQQFVDQELGLFIHWSINTYTGTNGRQNHDKVIDGTYHAGLVNPTNFDAYQWISNGKDMGAKYAIFTAKHRYGFCAWDSAHTTYDMGESQTPTLDAVAEFVNACNYYDIKPCLYINSDDVKHFPDNHKGNQDYTDYQKDLLTELLTNYGTIYLMWFDVASTVTADQRSQWYNHIKSIQPGCLVIFNLATQDADLDNYEANDPPSGNTTPSEVAYEWSIGGGWWAFNNQDYPTQDPEYAVSKKNLINSRNGTLTINVPPGPSGQLSLSNATWCDDIGQLLDGAVIYNNTSGSITYSGSGWANHSQSPAQDGNIHATSQAGDYAEITFNGTSVKFVTKMGAGAGDIDIYLDGNYQTTFDSYDANVTFRVVGYENTSLSAGEHTIRVVNAENGKYTHLDYFVIKENSVPSALLYTPVTPCRIVDTRKTTAGIINTGTERDFRVYGSVGDQGGDPKGCPSTLSVDPKAAHLNMIAVDPTGKGNLQAFPADAEPGAGLSVNYNTIDTNLANAGTVKTVTGSGPDITVASNFSSAHTVIDVLGYYYPDEGFYYTPVDPCRIVDTRKTSAGIIGASTQRGFRVSGSVSDQGGNAAGCPSTLGVSPEAAHLNMVAVDPTGKGNLQAFPAGAEKGAGLSVNYNTINTNLANAGTVKTSPDITVASNFSSAHTVIDVLGYYSEEEDLLYTPVTPCRIVDTRKTSAGIIGANSERNFRVYGSVVGQGGDSAGCPSPGDEPLAAHINMVAVNPLGKGNLQAFPVGAEAGAGLSVNYNTINTNLANAGTVKTITGTGPDITVASNFSSAHTVIDVLGYYYSAP